MQDAPYWVAMLAAYGFGAAIRDILDIIARFRAAA